MANNLPAVSKKGQQVNIGGQLGQLDPERYASCLLGKICGQNLAFAGC